MGAFMSNNVFINSKDRVVVSGSYVVSFHKKMTGKSITTINGKCYIDGFELVNGKWRRTLAAFWHKYF